MAEREEPKEFVDVDSKPAQPKERKDGIKFIDFLTGNIFTRESISRQFPFLLFLVFIAIFYINNHYRYDRLMRTEQKLRSEVKNLRAESVTTAAKLMQISRQSEVIKLVEQQGLGLQESTTPPKKVK